MNSHYETDKGYAMVEDYLKTVRDSHGDTRLLKSQRSLPQDDTNTYHMCDMALIELDHMSARIEA